ncbi:creatininase family protein [Neobacillus cucumis]|uniref:creatininase family protein n=1 Tax=Neobacillus cucumis TaxID=1740721 RepID=UPI002E1DE74D|nr:creatininase family protein [Neobacillus cucumis]
MSVKTNFLKEMSWKTFKERKESTDLVIIPSGAFEVYGPHLPLGSDTLVSVKIAELVAERVNAIISPTLEVGDSAMLDIFPGTITIKPESFKAYLIDIVISLKKWGFKDFLFINTHLGNVPIIGSVAHDLQRNADIRCAQIDYWRFIKSLDKGIIETGDLAHAHASEAGTSVLLHLYPHLVDMEKAINEPPKYSSQFSDFIQYTNYDEHTTSGTIGNAIVGTEEKGKALVERSVDRIVQFLQQNWEIREKASIGR